MSKRCFPRVAVLGEGEEAERWASALGDLAQVCPLPQQLTGQIDALVITRGAGDPFARAKEALQAEVAVLYAAPFLLSPWQAGALNDLSRRQGQLLRFAELFQYQPGFAFLRRLLEGGEPLWRPLYLRMLCLAQPDGAARIDELAIQELAICGALLGDEPRSVTATASRRNGTGDVCAVFLVLHYNAGPLVQCTISLAEATSGRQLVAATPDHTLIMDELGPIASLRIVGGEHELFGEELTGAASGRGRGERLFASPEHDAVAQEAKRFLSAVTEDDRSVANGERWERVAALWWAARQSMNMEGPAVLPVQTVKPAITEPPPLRVIEGGGHTAQTARSRPSLTVVNR